MMLSRSAWLTAGLAMPMLIVCFLHVIQAVMIWLDDVGTTTVIGMTSNSTPSDWVPIAMPADVLAGLMVAVSLVAGTMIFMPGMNFRIHILAWLPQQLLVAGGAVGALQAMYQGYYLDGTGGPYSIADISREHVIADQAGFVFLAIAHFVSFVLWQVRTHELSDFDKVVNELVDTTARDGTN